MDRKLVNSLIKALLLSCLTASLPFLIEQVNPANVPSTQVPTQENQSKVIPSHINQIECSWQKNANSSVINSTSCTLPILRSDLVRASAIFPNGQKGEILLRLQNQRELSNRAIIGSAILNNKEEGNFQIIMDGNSIVIEADFKNGERVEIRIPHNGDKELD